MKKYFWIIGGFAVAILVYLLWTFYPFHQKLPEPDLPSADEPREKTDVYKSPIDFVTLQAKNPDIFGWLDIPDTDISYPLVQSPSDDTLYLTHDAYGEYDRAGALFTEHLYNNNDMSDPATVIYGHRQNDGSMFGTLQQTFSDPESFASHNRIVVYMPDGEFHYDVRAALPYDNRHILYQYDFHNAQRYDDFLYSVYDGYALGANFTDERISTDDTLLILSTCLKGNRKNRFLVLAVLDESQSVIADITDNTKDFIK